DALVRKAMQRFDAAHPGVLPAGLSQVVIGARSQGEALVRSPRVPVGSATGRPGLGGAGGGGVAERFGRAFLELGANNAMIVAQSAALDLAVRAITFAAAGTAGQRCTTLRRLFVPRTRFPQTLP